MHWRPHRAGGTSSCLLLRTMGLVSSRWKTMGREYRPRYEREFCNRFSQLSRRELDWAWRLWRGGGRKSGGDWRGVIPGTKGGGEGFSCLRHYRKKRRKEERVLREKDENTFCCGWGGGGTKQGRE